MEHALEVLPRACSPPDGSDTRACKRMRPSASKEDRGHMSFFSAIRTKTEGKSSLKVVDYSDPFAIPNLIERFDYSGQFGSVTREIQDLIDRKNRALRPFISACPQLLTVLQGDKKNSSVDISNEEQNVTVSDAKNDCAGASKIALPIVVIDSDEEEERDHRPILPHQPVHLAGPVEQLMVPVDLGVFDHTTESKSPAGVTKAVELSTNKEKGIYIGVDDNNDSQSEIEDDGFGDFWTQMSLALECTKDAAEDLSTDERVQEGGDYCEHSFVLKDDLGYVCRACGVIERSIETIIDIQFYMAKRRTRTYMSSPQHSKDGDSNEMVGVELSQEDANVTDIAPHSRHMKQMKPHQVEGFKFLCSNLVADNPEGCIMAHAPGSGKTFMIISFMQIFLAKYPHARPLVVLPKGLLPTWKKEFHTWQVEDNSSL